MENTIISGFQEQEIQASIIPRTHDKFLVDLKVMPMHMMITMSTPTDKDL